MTSDVICVDEEDHIGHVAWLMVQRCIKRVPVVRAGKLVGIIPRADIIKLLAQGEE